MKLSHAVIEAIYSGYNDDQPLEARLKGGFQLLTYGYLDNAQEVLEKLKEHDPWDARVRRLDRACARAQIYNGDEQAGMNGVEMATLDGLPNPIRIRAPSDVMVLRARQSKQVLIAFGGASEAFWAPPQFLDLTGCHLIVLRDARRLFHLAGVQGLGANYAECLEGLKRLVAELGATKVFMTGSSSGAFAALRYGLDYPDARGVLAISPITGSDASDMAKSGDRFPALRPILRTQPDMFVDMLPLYQEHPNPPKVIIVWGEKHAVDNEQATRMGVLPNVTLEPMRGVAHHPVLVKLITTPELDLVKRLLAL